ncbi:MAG: DUF4013 domain-containing protein [Nitrososphaerota archaeon]|nr:DUF4013 domain-containing protein [Candidatus Calditenuaceae archaeon]MDW8073646.1 DUF4013 domain-containing protein [Nitrososphaerota archaeon]
MRLEENLKDSYEYTTKLFKDIGRLAILIVLNIIPIVNFIVTGYFAKVIRESPRSNAPPVLEKYGELWIDGAKVFIVMLVYLIVPIILVGFGAASAMVAGPFMPATGLALFGGTLTIIGIVLTFFILVVAVMAVVHMVKTGKMGDAFDFNAIFSKIRAIGWPNYILWIFVIFVIGLLLSGLSAIPIIGWLIALIISPVFIVFIGRSASNIYEATPTTK